MSAAEMHDRAWMAAQIRKSEDWIAHNMHKVPHIKIGRDVWFTPEHVAEFIEAHQVKPSVGRTQKSRSARRAA